jgi:hypothetical protein
VRPASSAGALDHVPCLPRQGRYEIMIVRIIGVGYINPKILIWVSELDKQMNMGLPMCSFKFLTEGATQPFQAQSHAQQPNGMFVPTPTNAQTIEEAHMALVRAWEGTIT